MSPDSPDSHMKISYFLQFNGNRLYGAWMFSQLFSNWKQIYTEAKVNKMVDKNCEHCYQHIIQKVLNKNELV